MNIKPEPAGESDRSRSRSVCLFTYSHPADYSRFLHREAASLARAGYRVTLVGLGSGPGPGVGAGIHVVGLQAGRGLGKLRNLIRVARMVRSLSPDICHCFDPWALGVGLWIRRRRPEVRLVYDSTEDYPAVFTDRTDLAFPVRWLGYAVVRLLESLAVRKAAAILETNRTRSRRFTRLGRRVTLVPNYPITARGQEPEAERNPWLAYTGLISYHRGFHILLQAFARVAARFPDTRLVVAGTFDPRTDIEVWTRSFLGRVGIKSQVEFLGWLPYGKMFDTLRTCLAGVILLQPGRRNDWTGQPNKLFDFMASGLAVVASDFPEIGPVVRLAGCGWLVDPTSIEQVASAIEQVLVRPEECRSRGRAGWHAVQDRCNWQAAEHQLLQAYEGMTS